MKLYKVLLRLENADDFGVAYVKAFYCDTYTDTNNVRWLQFYDEEDVLTGCFRESQVVGYYREKEVKDEQN